MSKIYRMSPPLPDEAFNEKRYQKVLEIANGRMCEPGYVREIPQEIVKNESFTECELRDIIGFDCEKTLSIESESQAEILLQEEYLRHDAAYTEEGITIEETIMTSLGMMSEEEFLKIKENKRLDELLTQKETDGNLKKLGINFIPGNSNNI